MLTPRLVRAQLIAGEPMPVVAIGVATDNDAGGKLWRALYRQPVAPPVTEVDDVPAAPCCAVR